MQNLKRSLKITGWISLICVGIYPIVIILMMMGINADLIFSFPLFSGFIHGSIFHFVFNIILLFFLFVYNKNNYTLIHIIIITTIISSIYYPFTFLGACSSVGISGFCYFLMPRFFFMFKRIKWLRALLIIAGIIIALAEIITINDSDGIAHGSHLIGFLLGCLSIIPSFTWLNPKNRILERDQHKISLPLQ